MRHRIPLRRWRFGLVIGLLLALASPSGNSVAEGYSEDAVKAVFLTRFAGYVEWPPSPRTQFTIAVLGAEGLALELQRLVTNASIDRLPAQIKRLRRIADVGDAQILYIGRDSPVDLRLAVDALGSRPVLLVTEDEHGLEAGGAISFLLVDQRVRFEVSLLAAERAGLRISSDLLSVAARVQGGRRRSEVSCGASGRFLDPVNGCAQRRVAGFDASEPSATIDAGHGGAQP